MYLSDRDLRWAIERGLLTVAAPPGVPLEIGPSSIDLHLDRVEEARIWDIQTLSDENRSAGRMENEVHLGRFDYLEFARKYHRAPPQYPGANEDRVLCRGSQVIVRPGGFLLWQTKERVGTPARNPRFICFIDGKSTRARTGLLVHLTAPTIHAGWEGNVVLEIANLGPLTFVLEENDVIAQITVAAISSAPERTQEEAGSATQGQVSVAGT
jgi:dCTP deaminase